MKKILGFIVSGLLLSGCNEITYNTSLYKNTTPTENIVVYAHIDNPEVKYRSSSTDQVAAQKSAANKCEAANQNNKKGCLRFSTSTRYPDGKINEHVGWNKAIARYKKWESEGFPTVEDSKKKFQKKLEEEKKRIAKAKKKKEEKTRIAQTKKKKEEETRIAQTKKTNQDNEAPVIQIAEAITVNDTDYEFQGKVTDQAKTIYVEVDGRPIDVKNGKFIVKGYSPIDKQISIEAIDQWGNRSEPKIVKLTIDIKDTSIAEKLEPLNPSKIRSKSSNNKVALIIGIENYLESPNAKYANLDAKYFFDYARKGFGVKKQNINLLVDEDATFVKTNKALTKWLRSKIKSGQSDLIIFFAGHGLASSDGKELYLLPQDSDPDLLARTALSRTELFQEIINLNPKSVMMFLDTCYSGVSRDEQMLLASARPIRIVADEQSEIPNNFTIFSASKLDQISSGLKEANHGIFSYYLMKGLEGKADSNQDKKITNGELLAYMDLNVSQKASELGRQQNPSLAGDPNKILMRYR